MTLNRTLLVVTLVAGLMPRAADAQIYTWVDDKGTQVFSDRKLDGPTEVYEVPGASTYMTTRPVGTGGASNRYDALVERYAEKESLRPELVRAVIQVESGFNPRARSPKGAMGLMQLMPQTARDLGVLYPYDPEDNIRGGTKYLRQLLDKYRDRPNREELALAAYNAGPGAVEKYNEAVPPYRETREYVKKVGSAAGRAPAMEQATSRRTLYKSIQIIDGRAIPKYSSQPPSSGTYEVITR